MGALRDTFLELVLADGGGKAAELEAERGLAPEVFGRSGTSKLTTGGGAFSGQGARRYLAAYASGTNTAVDLVADCLDAITGTAANAPWHLENPTAQTREEARKFNHRYEAEKAEHLAPQDLVRLLEQPNAWMSWIELVELTWIDWVLTGDMFVYQKRDPDTGRPRSLFRLSPAYTEVIGGENGRLVGSYRYSAPDEKPIDFAPSDIIHIKRPNPHSALRGAGVIAAGPRIFDMEVALQETKASYFENGARLSGVLESEGSISPALVESIRREFAGLFAGARQSYQVPVLRRGLKYKPMQSNAAEAEFVALTEKSQERILAKFRVPRRKLGLPMETSATTAPQAEERTFAQDVMRPMLNKFQNAISAQLTIPGWGLRFVIDYKYEMPMEDRVKLSTEFATLPGVTLAEVREFAGLPPLEGKNEKHNDTLLNLPGDNENASKIKDKPLGPEAGRPPLPEHTASFDQAQHPDARVRA